MKLKDSTTLSIAAAVSDVVEGRVKKEEAKYPHDMFHPETGEKKVAKDEAEHKALADKGYTHDKPEVDEVAEPKAKGEKDFKDAHKVKKTYGPGAVAEEDEGDEEEVDEALQPVTKIRFDYKDTMPKSPKPSDVGGLKQDWKSEKMSVKGAVKSLGGLVTDSEAPSKSNKFVGTISIGTRGDASKLSNAAIQKAVKSKGAEIQSNQFESVVEVEENTAKVDPRAMASDIPQMELSKFLKKATRAKGLYFDGASLIASKKTKFPDKTTLAGALDPKKKYTVQDLIKAVETMKEEVEEETIEEGKFPKALLKKATDLALKMGGNMTGAVKKIEKMKKGLSDDPEVKAALQLANEEVTEEIVAEAHAMNEAKSKMAEDKERYQKFFKSALKKFGVTSPGELEGEKKKEFFNYVDKNYEADNEED